MKPVNAEVVLPFAFSRNPHLSSFHLSLVKETMEFSGRDITLFPQSLLTSGQSNARERAGHPFAFTLIAPCTPPGRLPVQG